MCPLLTPPPSPYHSLYLCQSGCMSSSSLSLSVSLPCVLLYYSLCPLSHLLFFLPPPSPAILCYSFLSTTHLFFSTFSLPLFLSTSTSPSVLLFLSLFLRHHFPSPPSCSSPSPHLSLILSFSLPSSPTDRGRDDRRDEWPDRMCM